MDNIEQLLHASLVYDGSTEIDNETRRLIQIIKTESEILEQRKLYDKCHEMQKQLDILAKDDITDAILHFIDDIRTELDNSTKACNSDGISCLFKKDGCVKMKCLIVEDDFTSRTVLQKLLSEYAECHIAANGKEAVKVFADSLHSSQPYQLICLDIMMPEMDGQDALKKIRRFEEEHGILSTQGARIIMTTALNDMQNVKNAYHSLCDGYLVKPIIKVKLIEELQQLGLLTFVGAIDR